MYGSGAKNKTSKSLPSKSEHETDPRLRQWLHRLDAVIIALLLVGLIFFVRSHWKNRLRVTA